MIADDLNILRTRFLTLWPSSIPVTYANAPDFSPPAGAAWVRFIVNPPEAEAVTMGPHPIERSFGSMILQIFSPLGTGDGRANEIADIFAGIFRGWDSGTVTCGSPKASINPIERSFYSINVRIPYSSDHIY